MDRRAPTDGVPRPRLSLAGQSHSTPAYLGEGLEPGTPSLEPPHPQLRELQGEGASSEPPGRLGWSLAGWGTTLPFESLTGAMRVPELKTQSLPDLVIVLLIIKHVGRCDVIWLSQGPSEL